MKIQTDVNLGRVTTIWVWSTASYFSLISSREDLMDVFAFANDNNLWLLPLGIWSNIFFYNDVKDKIVIQMKNNEVEPLWDGLFEVWAWVILQNLIIKLSKIWYDLSDLSWYPSTIWWAILVNSWLLGKSISDFLESANLFNLKTWVFEKWENKDFKFDYRYCCLKWTNTHLLFDAVLKVWKWEGIEEKVKSLISERLWKQPGWRCSWCFFKNPKGLIAWKLIDDSGLKWYKIWWAFVSWKHANFLMTDNWSTKEDLFKLKEFIKKTVFEKYWVMLEEEVVVC